MTYEDDSIVPNDPLWIGTHELARLLGITYRTLRWRMKVWTEHEAEVPLPDGTSVRLWRRGHRWYAKRVDLLPSMTVSAQRRN
jgi:hypothetical protein